MVGSLEEQEKMDLLQLVGWLRTVKRFERNAKRYDARNGKAALQ